MRFYSLILIIWVQSLYSNISACDVCGCVSMGFSMGEWSPNSKYSLSSNYGFRRFTNSGFKDNFHLAELVFNYRFSSKFHLETRLPFLWAERRYSGALRANEQLQGLGDLSVSLAFELFSILSTSSLQSLYLSAGLNLPTGAYQNSLAEDPFSPNFQLGTASLDYQATLAYQINTKNYMGFVQTAYLLNTRNRYHYTFGNQAFLNLRIGRKIKFKEAKSSWLFFVGLSGEHFARDINERFYYQAGTGGSAAFADIGAYYFLDHWRISLSSQNKIAQRKDSNYKAGNQLKLKINYSF